MCIRDRSESGQVGFSFEHSKSSQEGGNTCTLLSNFTTLHIEHFRDSITTVNTTSWNGSNTSTFHADGSHSS